MTARPRSDGAGKFAVFIVEGDGRVRRGIRSIIESFPNLEVVEEAVSARAALELVEHAPGSVVIVDLDPSRAAEDLQMVRELRRKGCSVVAMSGRSGLGAAALAAGAVAFVQKDERGAARLVDAIHAAAIELKQSPNRNDPT